MEMTIAVISDLHCHHSSQEPAESLLISDADRAPSSQHPVEALLDLIRTNALQATALLMPGDFTNRVDRQGFHSGWGLSSSPDASRRHKLGHERCNGERQLTHNVACRIQV